MSVEEENICAWINQTYIIIPDFQDCPAFHITSVGDGRYHSCIFASPRYWLVIVLFYNDIACVNAIFLQDMHLKLINTGGCQNHTTYWVATRFVEHIVTDEIQPYKANCNFPLRSSRHFRYGQDIFWSAGLSSGPATVFFSRSR